LPRQSSQLLPALLARAEGAGRLEVLDLGPARPETVAHFSDSPCRLHIADLFAELPLAWEQEAPDYAAELSALLPLAPDVRFDVVLFWDLFNYLPVEAIQALQAVLRPHLHPGTRAHAFGVHKRSAPENTHHFGILAGDTLALSPRPAAIAGYAPLSQARLQACLSDFRFERSVLLGDGRLELLLLPA
jgi:hypothetical protein